MNIIRRCLFGAVTVFFFLINTPLARPDAPRRLALVIGNGAYTKVGTLPNPPNDAQLIASTLQSLGFTLEGGKALLNLNKAEFDQAVQNFGNHIGNADVALFYYAGHGLQVNGENYLVPVDANPTRIANLPFELEDAQLVLNEMEDSGASLRIMILDACRNNPFPLGSRAVKGGLASMTVPEGTVVSFSTQPNNIAQDGIGSDSPYSAALAATLPLRGLDVLNTFNKVGIAVANETGQGQLPWISSSPITGVFYFGGPPTPPPALPPGPPISVRMVGGTGGSYDSIGCGPGEVLLGLQGTKYAFLVQLGIICGDLQSINHGVAHFAVTSSRGPFGQAYARIDHWTLKCDTDSVVTGATIGAASYGGSTLVGSVQLQCSPVRQEGTKAVIEHSQATQSVTVRGSLAQNPVARNCSEGAVTRIHVRSGAWIDALGAECGQPVIVSLP